MSYEVTVTAENWSSRGEAMLRAKKSDRTMAIFGGIPGEEATVRVVHEGRNQSQALYVSSDSPSEYRVEPSCAHYEKCGGCPSLHLNIEGQKAQRHALMGEMLAGENLTDVQIGEFFSADAMEDYRHVLKLGVGYNRHRKVKVGAWGRRNREVVPIAGCQVVAPVLRKAMATVAHFILEMDLQPYEPEIDKGVLRSVVLRASRTTGEVLVTLIAGRKPRYLNDLAEQIAQGCTEIVGVWVHVNKDNGNTIFTRNEQGVVGTSPLLGKATIEEELCGVTYRIGSGDFFQTHPAMAEKLYSRTLDRLGLKSDDAVVDLYCGVGGFALQAAKKAGWVLGVEEVDGAVERAREAARVNKLNAEFLSGSVLEVLPQVADRLANSRPIVVVNPARRGLEEGVIDAICALKPRKIAYVSCGPRALARDLATFRELGFTIEPIDLFDMFPNTPHMESLTLITAPDVDAPTGRAPRRKVVRR